MIVSSKGIVLASFPYSESSVICKVYTRDHGINSFLLKGARTAKSKQKLAAMRSLQPIEVVHYRGRSDLYLVKEIRISEPLHSIASSAEKTCIALFLSELLVKCLHEEVADDQLYDFLHSSVSWLDLSDEYLNFHLQFMLQLSRYLGFYPKTVESFYSSSFGELQIAGSGASHREVQTILNELIERPEYNAPRLAITNEQRRTLLAAAVRFYGFMLEKHLEIKSLPVLESIFSD